MSQILSQGEVDALLRGISDGVIESEPEEVHDPAQHKQYDLTNQDRIIRGRMPNLEMTNDKFARMFRITLSSLLKRVVNIHSVSVDIIKYGEFIRTIPLPASFHIFKMSPFRGHALFIVESKMIFTLVDILFGGAGREPYKVEGRDFTSIEVNLIRRVILSALTDFEKAWEQLIELDVTYDRAEVDPQFAQIVAPTDVVIVSVFDVEMEFSSGKIILVIPYGTIEPIREKLQSAYQSDKLEVDKIWADRFKEELKVSNVNITAELGKAELSAREIMNLKKGDVIFLERYFNDDLDIFVEGIPKFKGQPGFYKGNQSIQISRYIRGDEVHFYETE